MRKAEWIFFDIGSTLADESKCYEKRFEEMIRGTAISLDEFKEKVIEFSKQNLKGDKAAAEYYKLALTKWHCEAERPFADAKHVLEVLKSRDYKLGIIANQLPGARKRLELMGILLYFDVISVSSDEGIAKPNPEIFLRALEKANCSAEEAIMVGDRLDNDIAPAKALGMKTVWVKQGLGKYASIRNEREAPDFTVSSLGEILNILQ